MAGFGPEHVDFAEIHDAFAPFELISLEDIGLLPQGSRAARRSTATPRSTVACRSIPPAA